MSELTSPANTTRKETSENAISFESGTLSGRLNKSKDSKKLVSKTAKDILLGLNGSKAERTTSNLKRKRKKIKLPYYNCVLKDTNFRALNAAY